MPTSRPRLALLALAALLPATPVRSFDLSPPEVPPELADALGMEVETAPEGFLVTLSCTREGTVTWPRLAPPPEPGGWSLPTHEGRFVPAQDSAWIDELRGTELEANEQLSFPALARWTPEESLALAFLDDLLVTVRPDAGPSGLGMVVSHRFRPSRGETRSRVLVQYRDPDLLAPAHLYRSWLERSGGIRTLAAKQAELPKVSRLIGATHAYLHGAGPLAPGDVRSWPKLTARLRAISEDPGAPGGWVHPWLSPGTREALEAPVLYGKYPRGLLLEELGRALVAREVPGEEAAEATPTGGGASGHASRSPGEAGATSGTGPRPVRPAGLEARREALIDAWPDCLASPEDWGGSLSAAFLEGLRDRGLDRLCLTVANLSGLDGLPETARAAERLGFLLGPYDSYNSVHEPGAGDSWETAQFDRAAYEEGAIRRADGTPRPGFLKRGHLLSPQVTAPYRRARIAGRLATHPYSSWFVDCDAYGQAHDDYSPRHPATREQDRRARIARLRAVEEEHRLVVGSEGGVAAFTDAYHYAHGMTTPVFGWGNAAMYRDRDSAHYLGAWFPNAAPARLVGETRSLPRFSRSIFDPRFRLPLFQAVFHDVVVTTHHWEFSSLKFSDQRKRVAWIDQLYNLPGLFHFTPEILERHGPRILEQHRFFARTHPRLSGSRVTGFRWLDPLHLVQEVSFGDRGRLVGNLLPRPFPFEGRDLPPGSVTAFLPGEEPFQTVPAPPVGGGGQ